MRSSLSLLLAGLLAIAPVRLISFVLQVNPSTNIHVNRFVRSLYLRPPPVNIDPLPMLALLALGYSTHVSRKYTLISFVCQ